MKNRPFGKHGFDCSEIGFAAWAIGGGWGAQADTDSIAALNRALDPGCNFIDTAAGYGNGRSEKLIAQVLRERAAAGKTDKVFVATKTPPSPGIWPPSPYCKADGRFDEGVLTGKFKADTQFPSDDFRSSYFAGDRLGRAVQRAEAIREDISSAGLSMAQAALKFVLAHPAVSTVIPGIRNTAQAESNCAASDLPDLAPDLLKKLRRHNWRRGFWYGGK
jgi:aryl-alcohol dehydrogenase-like predicted oxidoreductase